MTVVSAFAHIHFRICAFILALQMARNSSIDIWQVEIVVCVGHTFGPFSAEGDI